MAWQQLPTHCWKVASMEIVLSVHFTYGHSGSDTNLFHYKLVCSCLKKAMPWHDTRKCKTFTNTQNTDLTESSDDDDDYCNTAPGVLYTTWSKGLQKLSLYIVSWNRVKLQIYLDLFTKLCLTGNDNVICIWHFFSCGCPQRIPCCRLLKSFPFCKINQFSVCGLFSILLAVSYFNCFCSSI